MKRPASQPVTCGLTERSVAARVSNPTRSATRSATGPPPETAVRTRPVTASVPTPTRASAVAVTSWSWATPGWRVDADNPTSSAYGIPQALPGEKMASAGADWATNPETQIRWGLGYIADRYGSPCSANAFKLANNWY